MAETRGEGVRRKIKTFLLSPELTMKPHESARYLAYLDDHPSGSSHKLFQVNIKVSNLQILSSLLIGGRGGNSPPCSFLHLPAGKQVLVTAAKLFGPLLDLVHRRWLEAGVAGVRSSALKIS